MGTAVRSSWTPDQTAARVLGLAALLCFTWVAGSVGTAWRVQSAYAQLLDSGTSAHPAFVAQGLAPDRIGRLDIPRLGLHAIVLGGADPLILRVAVGHVDGTAWPGERGHVVLAAHRDTFFRPLKDARVGDTVWFRDRAGEWRYEVAAIRIVRPRDVQVIDAALAPMLSLVTCYPMTYIGPAPLRLVVQAKPVGGKDVEP
ncbi:MAG TPA: class D sortase [Vicinamibacterales bacterium]